MNSKDFNSDIKKTDNKNINSKNTDLKTGKDDKRKAIRKNPAK